MIPRQEPSAALLRLAGFQAEVVTAEQARGHGVGRRVVERMIAEGRWQRLASGLYLTRPGRVDWSALAWGGVLLGGDTARVGGAAAAHLWGLGDEPREILVLTPAAGGAVTRASWRFVREQPGLRLPSRSSPPRTAVEDTVLDLCRESAESEVIDLVSTAVQQGLTTSARLRRRLQQRGRVRHRRLIELLLADTSDGAETPLEIEYVRDVERAHGLPRGCRQVRAGTDVRDVVYEAYGVVVELDGRLGHEGLDRFRDMRRDNRALLRGEAPLRYGWFHVHERTCQVAFQVASMLNLRGWTGLPERCDRCLHVPVVDLAAF